MYPWVKAVLALIIVSIISLTLFIFRDALLEISFGDDDKKTEDVAKPQQTEEVKPVEKVEIKEPVKTIEEVKATEPVKVEPKIIKDSIYDEASKLFEAHKYSESRELLWKAIADKKLTENDKLFWQYAELLDKINTLIITTDLYVPDKIRHTIVAGDSLSKLAKRYKTTVETIKKTNNIPADRDTVFAGQSLSIYAGFWSVKAIKSRFKLILFDQNRVFKVYDIATGRQNRTPVAKFTIKTKQKNPDWCPPGRVVPFGHPDNPLGTRWMGLAEVDKVNSQHQGYGIHGTADPNSIGSSASNGCLRLRNEDVEELYDILPYRTFVEIVE